MTSRPLSAFLARESQLARITEKAARLSSLQEALARVVPAELARHCSVANVREAAVVIHASTNAAAARLRMLAPRLLATFTKSWPDISSVRIEVQIPRSPTKGTGQPMKVMPGPIAGAALDALSQQLPEARLRDAIDSLARKARRDR